MLGKVREGYVGRAWKQTEALQSASTNYKSRLLDSSVLVCKVGTIFSFSIPS